ncbi:purine catabolism regulator [Prauserella shujinwangii]|uniref:Purine catabolism regulator n=1 Tax=Prauserella shujinwangii TaxID=1453103 RepID=A0A2T0LM41_9PSEU|nr:PucR family transcriptional regulator [Prauserella shujinwangii]PRX44145.1 purine catabolism regulator [Prauserella shujinwangii]
MALTLRGLAARPSLGLRVRAGAAGLDRGIAWVHPTELADPTAFLDGGELLLTTGLTLGAEPAADYVDRLVAAGVAGVGFGSGLSHDEVPPALVAAAGEAGLPLLEVPRRTPFIAITKAVSAAVAADEYAAVVRTGRGQQELTRTALARRGPGALVRKLARLVDAWVLLLDGSGAVREAAPAAARSRAGALRGELRQAGSGSLVTTVGGDEVLVQALGSRGRGFLAVGSPHRLDSADRHVVTTAASLLSLALERDRARGESLRGLRSGLAGLLLGGQAGLALETIGTVFGAVAGPPWTVTVLAGTARARAVAVELLETEPTGAFFAEYDGAVLVLGAERDAVRVAETAGLHAGVSPSTTDVAAGYRQARAAAEAALAERRPVLRFAEHAGGGLLELVGPDRARAFADALLGPLRDHAGTGRGELEDSLRCWLEHNGHWDRAAARLGVHRHTLRNRMAKVARLTGRDLDRPGTRAEFWLALHAGP